MAVYLLYCQGSTGSTDIGVLSRWIPVQWPILSCTWSV